MKTIIIFTGYIAEPALSSAVKDLDLPGTLYNFGHFRLKVVNREKNTE